MTPYFLKIIAITGFITASVALGQVTVLQNNTTRTDIFGGTGSERYYQIDVPPGYSRLSIRTFGNDVGDCDIYARRSALPSRGNYDFRSNASGNDESITVTNPGSGSWYIMLYAYSTYIGVTLQVSYSGTTDTNVSVGNKIWDFGLNAEIYGAPCVASDGTIYLGTSGGGNFYALNPDGTEKWRNYFGYVSASPAIGTDGAIYVIREIGQLLAISSSGSVLWTFARTTHGRHSVAVAKDGTIYVPSNANSLLAVNNNNTLKWEFSVESGFLASSAPVVGADGTIYCGFYHSARSIGRLYAIEPNGTEKWRYDVGQEINTPAIDENGTVIFGVPNPVNKVYAINSTGTKKWESQASWGGYPYSECYIFSAPVVGADGTIFISSNRRLVALDPRNGAKKWHHDNGVLQFELDHASGPAIDSNGIIYYGSLGIYGSGELYAIKPDGTLAWPAYSIGQISTQPVITSDGKVIVGSYDARKLVALKASGPAAQSVWPMVRQNLANTASLDGIGACTYTLSFSGAVIGANAGTTNVNVTALSGFGCRWTVSLPCSSWLRVSPANATGNGQVTISVDANNTGSSRNCTVTIAGQLFSVTQQTAPDTKAPSVTITAPKANTRLTDSVVTVQGTASDNVGVASVEYRLENSNGVDDYQTASGTSNWSATLSGLLPGTDTVRVRARDLSGNLSTEVARSFVYVIVSPFSQSTLGNGTVSPNLNGQSLEIGKSYTLTAKPGIGYVFSNWTGSIVASTPTLAFVMQSNIVLQANFIPNPFASVKGVYNGLFSEVGGVAHESSGFLSLALTERGTYSGKFQFGGRQYSLSGQFDVAGTASKTILRRGMSSLTATMALDLIPGGDRLTGTIGDGLWLAELSADRAVFDRVNLALQAGKYTLLFPGSDDSSAQPGGDGFGALTVDSSGNVKFAGTLGDGTKVSQKTTLSKNGQWPFYASLYSDKGSILGWLTFTNEPTHDVNGLVSWTKPSLGTAKYYPAGFATETQVIGSRYNPPTGSSVLNFTDGMVVLADGNLSQSITNDVVLGSDSKVTNLSINKLKLTIVLPSGLLKGTVTNPANGKSISIKGAVLQKQNAGFGQFFGTNQTGRVWFGPL